MSVLKAGLIGEHISRTRLPAALDIMCKMHGLTLEFELIDTATRPGFDFTATVDGLRAAGWTGVTVTHPYKTHAASYAGDGMLPELQGLGASNTLIFDDPLSGHNTDFTGFISAFKAFGYGAVGDVVMIGAGGVARAIGPAIAQFLVMNGKIAIYDRDMKLAKSLAAAIGETARAVTEDELPKKVEWAEGLINATPMGMVEYPGSAFDRRLFSEYQNWAFDAVYTPTDTQFLIDARAAGMDVLTGFSLFQHMALGTFAAYTGIIPDAETVLPKLDTLRPE